MINNYLEPKEFRIDISELYRCVKSNRENIDSKLILEFRNRAEDFMIYNEDIKPEVPFDKTKWEYIKGKYQYFIEETIEGDFVNVDYFFNQRPTPQELFEPSEWEAFEKCNPLLQEASSRKPTKKKKKLKIRVVTEDVSSKIKPRFYSDNWWDYSYDLYSYFQPVHVPVDFSNSDFQYFFAWYLALSDPMQITSSFFEILMKESGRSKNQVLDYLDVLIQKFRNIFENSLWHLNKNKILNFDNNNMDSSESLPAKGRPTKDFLISKPTAREINDKKTSLVTEATAYLFEYLQKRKVILSKKDGLSNKDLSKIISGLCGYTPTNINKSLSVSKKNKIELNNIKSELEAVIGLINKDLGSN